MPAAVLAFTASPAAAQQAAPLAGGLVYQLRGTTGGGLAPATDEMPDPLAPEEAAPLVVAAPAVDTPEIVEPLQGRVLPEPPVQALADVPEEGTESLANAAAGPIETGVPAP